MKFNLFQVYPAIWNSTNLDGEEMRRKSREVALASASRDKILLQASVHFISEAWVSL